MTTPAGARPVSAVRGPLIFRGTAAAGSIIAGSDNIGCSVLQRNG